MPLPRRASPVDDLHERERRRLRWSIAVARIAGIDVRVHVTFVVLVGLVAWSNAAVGDPVVPAVGWLLALFACVVVHELAHSVVAHRVGVPVREIDLLPIGGMSRLERLPARWQDEVRIAVAGPLASVAVAGLAAILALLVDGAVGRPDVVGGPWWSRLVWINLLLAAFNLVPAFPMDGGRVLRGVLQRREGRVASTHIAVRVSRYVAWAFILGGLLVDVWLALIGAFVLFGGKAELASVEVHEQLDRLPVGPLVRPCPVVLRADTDPARARALASGHPQLAYPVVSADGQLVGAVTPRDLGSAPGTSIGARCREVAAIGPAASTGDALDASAGGLVVVVDHGWPVGVVDPARLQRWVDAAWARRR